MRPPREAGSTASASRRLAADARPLVPFGASNEAAARAAGEGPREAGIDGNRESPAGGRLETIAQIVFVQ